MEWPCPEPFLSCTQTLVNNTFSPCCAINFGALVEHVIHNIPKDIRTKLISDHPEIGNDLNTLLETLSAEEDLEKFNEFHKIPQSLERAQNIILGETTSEYFTSYTATLFKEAFINNNKQLLDKVCKACRTKEDSGVESYRQSYLKQYDVNAFQEAVANYKQVPQSIHSIDVTGIVGNACNLSCNMCHPVSSSKYGAESMKLKEIPIVKAVQLPRITEEYYNDLVVNILPKAQILKVAGGEPMMSKNLFRLLERMPDKVKANLNLQISTNLTITKNISKVLDLIRPFKQTKIHVSIEGVGLVQEYIRYPSKWHTIVENCQRLRSLPNTTVIFATTVNALNIGYNYQVVDEYSKHVDGVSFGSLVTNNFYSIRSIPPDLREIYINKLYSHYRKNPEIAHMIKMLSSVEYKENEMWSMMAHIKRRDKYRGMNLLEVFPEWEKYYTSCTTN